MYRLVNLRSIASPFLSSALVGMIGPISLIQAAPKLVPVEKFSSAHTSSVSEGSDGPYLLPKNEGWTAHTIDEQGTVSSSTVVTGEPITVGGVGLRPKFVVPLRGPAPIEPDLTELASATPVFLLADTHGEFEIATELLLRQGVIDSNLRWSFGRGRLVVLGDIFDRGPHQIQLLWLFYKLEAEALAAKGRVHIVLGNHEAMVLTGDLRYLHSRYHEIAAALGVATYQELVAKETLLGQWLRTKPTVFKLGQVLCLHGGMSVGTISRTLSLAEINTIIRDWINDEKSRTSGRLAFLKGVNGPLWYRGYFREDPRDAAALAEIEAVKKFYGVERITVGHTIVPSVTSLYNGSVIAVQVYPKKDAATGQMNMEGVYIDEQGVWHKAKIDGTREILRDDAGNPIRNGVPTPATGSGGKSKAEAEPKPAEQKKAA